MPRKPTPPDTITLLTPQAIQRRLEKLSVTEVVQATGIHSNTIYRWRRGEVVDPCLKGGWQVLSDWLMGSDPVA